jgi:DNA-binding transcriptional ArsR family regulator
MAATRTVIAIAAGTRRGDGAPAAVDLLRMLGNESRLAILLALQAGEMSVANLEKASDVHQPALSQQLGILRTSRVVTTRREGRSVIYRVSDDRVGAIIAAALGVEPSGPDRRPAARSPRRGAIRAVAANADGASRRSSGNECSVFARVASTRKGRAAG